MKLSPKTTNADLWLFLVLVGAGLAVVWLQYKKPDAAAAATLAGAMFGGGAVLLGNWIARRAERERLASDAEDRRAKFKTLIAAELVNLAAGLIGSKQYFHAASQHAVGGGVLPPQPDLIRSLPRDMPFVAGAGVELLQLEQPAIDALVTLRANLGLTRIEMESIIDGRDRFGLLRIGAVSNALSHNLELLAQAFERIAPTRQLALPDHEPALASAVLRRVAANG
jgi:hypothetical protein